MEHKFMFTLDRNSINWAYNDELNRAFIKQTIEFLNDWYKTLGWLTVAKVFDIFGRVGNFKPTFYTACYGWDKAKDDPKKIEFEIQEGTDGNGETIFAVTFIAKQIIFMETE